MCNAKFEEKGLPDRIDHRSYERQGVEQHPTVHEGVAVRQMEARGLVTNKGERNRWIKSANTMLRALRDRIKSLATWLTSTRVKLESTPSLEKLLMEYMDKRNAGAWSEKAKVGNLKRASKAVSYLSEHKLHTLDDLEKRLTLLHTELDEVKTVLGANKKRSEELRDCLRYAEQFKLFKPLYDELNAIKWKSKREQFKAEHESELRQFYLARRKLPDGIHIDDWKRELDALAHSNDAEYAKYKRLRAELSELLDVKYCIDRALDVRAEGRKMRPLAEERD